MSQIAWIRPSLPSCAAISTQVLTALAPTLLTPSGRVRWLSPTCLIPCATQTSSGIFTPMLLHSPGPDGTAVFRPGSTWLTCLFRGSDRSDHLPVPVFGPLCRHRVGFRHGCRPSWPRTLETQHLHPPGPGLRPSHHRFLASVVLDTGTLSIFV